MKKKYIFFIALILTFAACFALSACVPESGNENKLVYTVRFHDNYQGVYKKIIVEAGKKLTLPLEPSRTGYTFKGWFLSHEADAALAFDAENPINEDITVYAKWQRDETVSLITLKFRNFRTQDKIYALEKGSKFAEPETPVYDEDEMYEFIGWYTDAACTQVYDFNSDLNDDLTLYADWIKKKAYVILDYNYTGSPEPIKLIVNLGETVDQIESPSRSQYEFSGWYESRVGGLPFNSEEPITSDITIYAHWSRSEYMVSFNLNGAQLTENIELNYIVKKNQSIEEAALELQNKMVFTGHDFAGWYIIRIIPGLEDTLPEEYLADLSAINDDMIVYAAWTLHEYEVTFDINYEGGTNPPEQIVKFNRFIESFDNPEREGYLFGGWFTEASCNNQFTFDIPVTSDLTLYAKWIEDSETHDNVTVRYFYNIGDGDVLYATVSVEFNGTVGSNAPADPEVNDYYFAGWFRDKAFTIKFSNNMNLTEDIDVYGNMLKKYTFEAEAVDFTGKTGQGTSTNSFEEQMIMDHTFVSGGDVSNGYFVRELYYNGAFLDFEIYAEDAISDAVLYLRVSSESYEFFTTKVVNGVVYNYLSDEEFKIVVNGEWEGDVPLTWLEYGGLYMPMANIDEREDLAQNKTPFENCFITDKLSLNKGRNVISLYVGNNNNHGGTFHAEAPIIDCIYIYSSTELTMTDYKFYERPNVIRG